jgi:hypothetical protein
MDASVTRRGQPCWYKHADIGTIAVNDAFLLRSALFVFLRAYFSSKDYYVQLLHMFNEVWSVRGCDQPTWESLQRLFRALRQVFASTATPARIPPPPCAPAVTSPRRFCKLSWGSCWT